MVDYLVVGLGLAGVSFCEMLEKHGNSFQVVDHAGHGASEVASGLYNPVQLKRFTAVWRASEQMHGLASYYENLEEKLQTSFHQRIPVLRRIASIEEQNNWFEAASRPSLRNFMHSELLHRANPAINAPWGYGIVKDTGRLQVAVMLEAYRKYLERNDKLKRERLDYGELILGEKRVTYKDIVARRVVFACGQGLKENPYFRYLPLQGNKGELLKFRAPVLQEERVVKGKYFIIPQGKGNYLIGATYNWKDKKPETTPEARSELEAYLGKILNCSFEITGQMAGIRPTVSDRRPLVGQHPEFPQLYVINGLGSRGVMIGPYAASQLYRQIEEGHPPDPEMDIRRFVGKYAPS